MRVLLKIVLFPIALVLNILLGMAKFVLFYGGALLNILSFLFFVLGVISLCTNAELTVWLPALLFGYAISPWGLPMAAARIVAMVECFNDWLKTA